MNGPTLVRPETADRIQTLIQLNIDSAKGFAQAAEQTKNPRLSEFFRSAGEERRQFAADLQSIVCAGGGTTSATGTTLGSLQRWWMGIRGAITEGEEHAMLSEAERGEDRIKHGYEHTLKEPLGGPIHEEIVGQYKQICCVHDEIRAMRDIAGAQKQNGKNRDGNKTDGTAQAATRAESGCPSSASTGTAVEAGLDPLAEDAFWRETYVQREYIPSGLPYSEVQPAYRFGWECARRNEGRSFEDIEHELRRDWETQPHSRSLTWERAKGAVRDAWDRVIGR